MNIYMQEFTIAQSISKLLLSYSCDLYCVGHTMDICVSVTGCRDGLIIHRHDIWL